MHAETFHVVDLKTHVGVDQHGAVGDRALLQARQRNAADLHRHARQDRIAALEQQEIVRRQDGTVADVEMAAAFD